MDVITVINYEYNETKSEFKLLNLFLNSTLRFNCLLNRTDSVLKPFCLQYFTVLNYLIS